MHESLIGLTFVEALERLGGREVYVSVLAPPHPAVGTGTLHVVRVEETKEGVEVVVTYDDYERIPRKSGEQT